MGLSKGSLSYWVRKKRKSSGKKPSFVELSSLVKPKVGIEASSKHLPTDAQAKLPRITYRVPRVTCQVSRIISHTTYHESRITYHVPRITSHVPRITYHVPRTTYHVSRVTSHATRFFNALNKPRINALSRSVFSWIATISSINPNSRARKS